MSKKSGLALSFTLAKGLTPFLGPAFLSATAFFIGSFLLPSLSMSRKSGFLPSLVVLTPPFMIVCLPGLALPHALLSFSCALSCALSPAFSAEDFDLACDLGSVCSSSLNLFGFSLCLVTPFLERSISPPVDDFSSSSAFSFFFMSSLALTACFLASVSFCWNERRILSEYMSAFSIASPYSLIFISYSI